jgi:hypothetical protein
MQIDTRAPAPSVSLGQCVPEVEANPGTQNKAIENSKRTSHQDSMYDESKNNRTTLATELACWTNTHDSSSRVPKFMIFLGDLEFDNETPSILQLPLTIILNFKPSPAASAIPCLNT